MTIEAADMLEKAATVAARSRAAPPTPAPPLPHGDQQSVVNDPRGPGVINVHDLWTYRELLYFLTWRDIKVRYKQTAMGAAWAIIQPLFMMIVFAIFFGLIGVPTDHMPSFVFFYTGLLPWTFFSNAISVGSLSLVSSSNLITKVYFPRVLVPAATVGAGLVDLSIATTILLVLTTYYGLTLTWNLLMLPVLFLLTVVLALGFTVWLAALTVKYRDVRHVLPFALQLWFFVTPIVYPLSVVPARWRWLMSLNPMTGIVEGIRSALIGRAFDWPSLVIAAVVTVVILVCAVFAFRRIEKSFADLI